MTNDIELEELRQTLIDIVTDTTNWTTFFAVVRENAHLLSEAEQWQIAELAKEFSLSCQAMRAFIYDKPAQA